MEKKDRIVEQVVEKLQSRSRRGIQKYDTTLEENNTDDFLLHLQEELLDAANYIEKLMDQRKEIRKIINSNLPHSQLVVELSKYMK